jgi:hypothetical protein
MHTLSQKLGLTFLISYGLGAIIALRVDGTIVGAITGGLISAVIGGIPVSIIQTFWHFIWGKSAAAAKSGALLAVPGAVVGGLAGFAVGLAGLAILWIVLIFSAQRTAAHDWVVDPRMIGGWFLALSAIGAVLGGMLAGAVGGQAGALTTAFRRS